jgi:MFS family permease
MLQMFTSPARNHLSSDLVGGAAAKGWLRPAVAVAAIGWGANQFSPLIVLYQHQGVSAAATEAMFGLYAVGLIPALMAGGSWSDRAGRRAVVVVALLLSLVASVVLTAGSAWHWLLFLGRLIAGVSSGLAFGAGAAWIKELSRLDGHPHTGPRSATLAMTIGFGGGPLVAGLGAAYGMTQFAGLADIQHVAQPSRLGVATSAYQALSYLGFSLPFLLTVGHT